MKRYKNENEFLAMVEKGEQEILSLISLFRGAMDIERAPSGLTERSSSCVVEALVAGKGSKWSPLLPHAINASGTSAMKS